MDFWLMVSAGLRTGFSPSLLAVGLLVLVGCGSMRLAKPLTQSEGVWIPPLDSSTANQAGGLNVAAQGNTGISWTQQLPWGFIPLFALLLVLDHWRRFTWNRWFHTREMVRIGKRGSDEHSDGG